MLDIHDLMRSLSASRPVFHSERDFQLAFAWGIHEMIPNCAVRLEYKPFASEALYLDIWLPTLGTAIELKYKTRQLWLESNQEKYFLEDQGAQNLSRYDFLVDVHRLERTVEERESAKRGFAVMLTNDRSYWDPPRHGGNETDDAAFRIHEGREFFGKLEWSHSERLRAKRTRKNPIVLSDSYHLHWYDYSDNTTATEETLRKFGPNLLRRDSMHPQFRYLALPVGDQPTDYVHRAKP